MNMQTVLVEKPMFEGDEEEFYNAVTSDIKQSLIQFISDRGHGKSSSLKNIVVRCKEKDPNIQFIAADVSQSWYKKSPLKYRQFVTREKINNGQVKNVVDCIYEIGSMTEEEQRAFIGIVIGQHYEKRYNMSFNNQDEFDKLPWLVFILEEANIYFNSYSMTKNDVFSPIFKKFVSVGRNYKMSAFLVSTAEQGEISPSLRRRSRRIYGRLVAEGDIARVRKTDKRMAEYLEKEIPRFNFVYLGSKFFGPIHVQDTVKSVPIDYIPAESSEPAQSAYNNNLGIWMFIMSAILIFGLFIWYLLDKF